jgi:hypothetical protein
MASVAVRACVYYAKNTQKGPAGSSESFTISSFLTSHRCVCVCVCMYTCIHTCIYKAYIHAYTKTRNTPPKETCWLRRFSSSSFRTSSPWTRALASAASLRSAMSVASSPAYLSSMQCVRGCVFLFHYESDACVHVCMECVCMYAREQVLGGVHACGHHICTHIYTYIQTNAHAHTHTITHFSCRKLTSVVACPLECAYTHTCIHTHINHTYVHTSC